MSFILFVLSVIVGTVGAFIGMRVCQTPFSGWWCGVITGALVLLTQNLIK